MRKIMKQFLLIVLFSSCVKTINREEHLEIQTQESASFIEFEDKQQESAPLILGGKHYVGRVGDLVQIREGYWTFTDEPRKCFIEDASSLLYIIFNIDPFDSNKMNSLENIELLINIKRLRIFGKNLEYVDFSPLSTLNTLEELIIEGDISYLYDLTLLRKLRRISIKKSNLETLDNLNAPNVEKIELEMKTFDSLAPLSNLSKLELLDISTTKRNISTIGKIRNVPNLKYLTLGIEGLLDLTGIEQLTGLANLRLGYRATPINAQGIRNLQNLNLLVMSIINDENPSIEYLRGLPNLSSVIIYSETWWALSLYGEIKEPYQILDISPLSECHKLLDIDLRGFIVKNIHTLNNLENLRYNAIILNGSKLFDKKEVERSTKRIVFDSSIFRDG